MIKLRICQRLTNMNYPLKFSYMSNQNNPQPQERPSTTPRPETGRERGTGPRTPGTQTR